jgi:DedD protein
MNKARFAMNETPTTEIDPTTDNEDALKRRLLNRIAIAAVMVVGLLGSLAMFDAINAPSHRDPAKVAALSPKSEPPLVTEPAATAETKPAEPAVETRPEPAAVVKTEETAVPESTASPGAPPLQPLPAEVSPTRPLTKPATSRPASMRPSEPVPPAASPAARPEPSRELAQSHAAPSRAPASRPISGTGERQFALQMGVFSDVANAEDLRAKLELNGIPSSIEARVHVGPFRTREEVEAVRAKLKELGLDGGLMVTMKK